VFHLLFLIFNPNISSNEKRKEKGKQIEFNRKKEWKIDINVLVKEFCFLHIYIYSECDHLYCCIGFTFKKHIKKKEK
jgi:hypothetical protein